MDIYWQEFEAALYNGYTPEEAKEIAAQTENDIFDMIEDMNNHLDSFKIN